MRAQIHAELFKQRTTLTSLGLLAALLGLVLFVVLLHGFGVPAEGLGSKSVQLSMLFGRGELLGSLFAALLGAMSITSETRHGTMRSTFLVTPWRGRVVAAKVWASTLIGAGFGLAAGAVAAGVGTAALRARGIDIQPDPSDFALLIAGGAAAAALWAAIGAGLGAIVRNQVPALVGISTWLLFIEGLLVGDLIGVGNIAPFAPGALGRAITGQDPDTLLAPAVGLVLLTLYAVAAAVAGSVATARRDVV